MHIDNLSKKKSALTFSSWSALTAGDVMTSDIDTVPLDWTMERLATFLADREISGAPVVDECGQLCGMVSVTDIARQTGSGILDTNSRSEDYREFDKGMEDCALSSEEMRSFHETLDQTVMVADIMTPVVFDVSTDTPLPDVASAMVKGHIHRVLVTENKTPRGIVSALDLLAFLGY